jgi:hypothetical protein
MMDGVDLPDLRMVPGAMDTVSKAVQEVWADPNNGINDGRRWMIEITDEAGQIVQRTSLQT